MPKTASPNGTVNYATLSPAIRRYEWFEMDRDEDSPDSTPLRVKVQRMTPAELEAVPVDNTPIKQVVSDYRHCYTAWNLTGLTDAGDVVPVPPPAELDDDSIVAILDHLLDNGQVQWLFQVLKAGHLLKLISEKKASIRSGTSLASSPEDSSADGP